MKTDAWPELLVAASLLFFAGCQHVQPKYTESNLPVPPTQDAAALSRVKLDNQMDPAWLQPPSQLFTLGPGDRLEIELLGEPTSKTTTVVGPDGKVYFNLLPGIDVWGLTIPQAKTALEQELAKYVRQQPQVSLVLRDVASKRVWVLGRVQA